MLVVATEPAADRWRRRLEPRYSVAVAGSVPAAIDGGRTSPDAAVLDRRGGGSAVPLGAAAREFDCPIVAVCDDPDPPGEAEAPLIEHARERDLPEAVARLLARAEFGDLLRDEAALVSRRARRETAESVDPDGPVPGGARDGPAADRGSAGDSSPAGDGVPAGDRDSVAPGDDRAEYERLTARIEDLRTELAAVSDRFSAADYRAAFRSFPDPEADERDGGGRRPSRPPLD